MRHILPVALAIGMAVALYLSPRGFMLTNMPKVERIEALPAGADTTKLHRFLNYGAILLPKDERERGAVTQAEPALGFSYREVSVLRLPMFAYPDFGKVLYLDTADQVQMTPLDADYVALLDKEAGKPLGAGYSFAWWKHIWGWAFVAGFLLWWWLQVRAERRHAFDDEAMA